MSGSLGAPGIGLTVVFGVFVMVLFFELYYIFFWKKSSINNTNRILNNNTNNAGLHYYMDDIINHNCNSNCSNYNNNSSVIPGYGSSSSAMGGDSVEYMAKLLAIADPAERMALAVTSAALGSSRRFLFTIKEETREDLEFSDDGRISATRQMSDTSTMDTAPHQFSCRSSLSSASEADQSYAIALFSTPPSSPSQLQAFRVASAASPGAARLSPFAAVAIKASPTSFTASPRSNPGTPTKQSLVTASSASYSNSSRNSSTTDVDTTPLFSPLPASAATAVAAAASFSTIRGVPLKYLFQKSPLQQRSISSSDSINNNNNNNNNSHVFTVIQNPLSFHLQSSPVQRGPLGLLFQQPSPIIGTGTNPILFA